MAAAAGEDEFQLQLKLEDQEKKLKENENENDTSYTYTDSKDGTEYEWDYEKKAWFPKIDNDFIATYQYNYGERNFPPNPTAEQSSTSENKKTPGKRPANESQGWFDVDEKHNTNVYVSNLPLDITEEEFVEFMSKCGLIMKDPQTNSLKMKLYRDSNGLLKGDGRCCYIKVESVTLALKILDGYRLRGKEIHVERAQFQMKGQYDPTKKPKKMKSKEKKKIKQMQEKLLDWRPDKLRGERYKHERTVIIKNMFDPEEFKKQPELILEYQSDLREECGKFGEVKKALVYDRHTEGVASVTFKEAEEADICIQALNGRWFGGRQLTAETWDGKSKYHKDESEVEENQRQEEWERFLEDEKKGKVDSTSTSTTTTTTTTSTEEK